MVRIRRKLQMLGKFPARKNVADKRHKMSKYRAKEFKATKKEISNISFEKFVVD